MRTFFYFFSILIIATSCKQDYKIEGSATILGLEGRKLFLRTLQENKWVDLDSTDIVHCEFKMKGKVDSTIMAFLFLDHQQIMPIVLEKGNVAVTIDNKDISAHGTLLNNTLYKFIKIKNNIEFEYEELNRNRTRRMMESSSIRNAHNQYMEQVHNLERKMQRLTDSFIQQNYENVLGPNFFMSSYGNTNFPLLTPEIKSIMDKAPDVFKNNSQVKYFISKAHENAYHINSENTPRSMEHNTILH